MLDSKKMEDIFDAAIKDSICPRKHPIRLQEPDYTALLTLNLPNLLNARLPQKIVLKTGVRVQSCSPLAFSGCFIHQSPYVRFPSQTFKSMKTCELGDLLVLCREILRDGVRYNAALLQLKLSRKLRIPKERRPVRVTGVRDRTQLDLYSHWPKFKFDRPLQAREYDLLEKHPFAGAQYMFVCEDSPASFSVALPQGDMYARDYTFAKFLVDFIGWNTGKEFRAKTVRPQDEWTTLIWDVINHISNQKIQRSNIGENNTNDRYNDAGKVGFGFLQWKSVVSDWDISRVMATLGEGRCYNHNSFGVLCIAKGEPMPLEL